MSLSADRDRLLADSSLRGRAWAERWSATVDGWLADQWNAVVEPTATGLALVAVGGYGRGDLCPGSDLDLLLLHRSKTAPAEVAEKVWYPIWDEGLKLGHSVRSVAGALDLAGDDLDTATSLLTVRHLAGEADLTLELATEAAAQWRKRSKRWLTVLRQSVAARQAQFGEVAFLLEPDLKDGRGGLRDIHALRWAEAARPILLDGDAADLTAAETVLLGARVELHRLLLASASRAGDQLALQDQDAVAKALGTDADGLMGDIAHAGRTVAWVADETWDRVAALTATSVSLLGWRSRERAPGLVVRDSQVHLEPSADPAAGPTLALDAALLSARKEARLARPTLHRLAERSPAPDAPWSIEVRDRFVELLGRGRAAIPVIEALDQAGIWERYLPEWVDVRHRPQRNAYHRFTVDRHLLETCANAASLVDHVDRPDLLLLGALLHDIGKGRPGDHTEVGMAMVADIGTRLGFDPADTDVLVDMVRHHLLLPDVAIRRDLSDERTIAGVAEAVGDVDRLHLLAALTEADSLATGPAAWGAWKADLVRDLVRRVDHFLRGGDLAALSVADFPDARQLDLLGAGERVVWAGGDTVEVVAPDRPGLFSRVAGVLALHGLEVRTADVASLDGMALERFQVTSPFASMIPWERVTAHIDAALDDRLAIEARLAERVRTYARRSGGHGAPPPVVRFDDTSSNTATIVEVYAPDRIGLLYRVLRAFAEFGLDVRVAKVQTLADLVIDAFYVTHADGSLVTDPDVRAELERALLHAVS
jgi:[protein-PII] uridylyltransferase